MFKGHLVLASPDSSTVRSLVLGLSWVGQSERERERERDQGVLVGDTTRNRRTEKQRDLESDNCKCQWKREARVVCGEEKREREKESLGRPKCVLLTIILTVLLLYFTLPHL